MGRNKKLVTGMKQKLLFIGSVILGNLMLAFSICGFVVPNGFMLGGTTGICLAIQKFLPQVPLSVLSALVVGVLFFLGWIFLGKQFAAGSILSTVIYPLCVALFEQLPLGDWLQADVLTCAIFASVTAGLGIGLVIRVGGSTGGMDIPPCILQKYKGIPVGNSMMFFDTAIVLLQVILYGTEGLLHSILIVFLISAVVNKTIVSGENAVQIIIISPEHETIRSQLLGDMDTGATMLSIETGYTGQAQKAVFCVTYAKHYPRVRDAVLKVDPKAFMVTTAVKNVNGQGYTIARNTEKL